MSKLYEYRPWSEAGTAHIIERANTELCILDIQLGGTCNANCVYCDSPDRRVPCSIDLNSIERLMNSGNIVWVYICGLGEPSAGANMRYLKEILKMCKARGIRLSMFSNTLNLDKELLDYIDSGILHVLFKLDTFDEDMMRELYGVDCGSILKRNYELLKEVVHKSDDGTTNLGASIVPTDKNWIELPSIISWCVDNGIYPFLGQLEDAGRGSDNYDKLMLCDNQLFELKAFINREYGVDYEIPICPSAIAGIHIQPNNLVAIESKTGISCPWSFLKEPSVTTIGDIRVMSYREIVDTILAHRMSRLPDVRRMLDNIEAFPLGGCGGNTKALLEKHVRVLSK